MSRIDVIAAEHAHAETQEAWGLIGPSLTAVHDATPDLLAIARAVANNGHVCRKGPCAEWCDQCKALADFEAGA